MNYHVVVKRLTALTLCLFLVGGCVSTRERTAGEDEIRRKQISKAILKVCIEQRATGQAGKYGFESYFYVSNRPQTVGIDPREGLLGKLGEEKLANYTNSEYVRFGVLRDKGENLGKLILADKKGDILRGTFCGSYDVTDYLKRHGNRRYYLATVAKLDRKTYAAVGVRCLLEVSTMGGKRVRSEEIYFLGRTDSISDYLAKEMRQVGLEIVFDVPPGVIIPE